jgi:RNA polymerase sigma-70 factor (ECF subfamily)
MAGAARGDEAAFRQLVERWEQPVYGFLERMTGSREEALDLSQETFLRVHAQAPRYRAQGRFRSWLFRIAGNLARSAFRRRRILRWVRFDPARHDRAGRGDDSERAMERREGRTAVRRALAVLPERQRQAVVLRHCEGFSQQDIAEAMSTTVPAVESLLQRALATLRRDLAGEVDTP